MTCFVGSKQTTGTKLRIFQLVTFSSEVAAEEGYLLIVNVTIADGQPSGTSFSGCRGMCGVGKSLEKSHFTHFSKNLIFVQKIQF